MLAGRRTLFLIDRLLCKEAHQTGSLSYSHRNELQGNTDTKRFQFVFLFSPTSQFSIFGCFSSRAFFMLCCSQKFYTYHGPELLIPERSSRIALATRRTSRRTSSARPHGPRKRILQVKRTLYHARRVWEPFRKRSMSLQCVARVHKSVHNNCKKGHSNGWANRKHEGSIALEVLCPGMHARLLMLKRCPPVLSLRMFCQVHACSFIRKTNGAVIDVGFASMFVPLDRIMCSQS